MAKAAASVMSPRFPDLEITSRALRWNFQRTTLEAELPGSGATLEVGLCRLEDLGSKPAEALSSIARIEVLWGDEAKSGFARFQQRLKKRKKTPGGAAASEKDAETSSHSVAWPQGHRLQLLGMPEKMDPFALHELLRERLAAVLKPLLGRDHEAVETVQLRLHLLSLPSEGQERALEAFAFLLTTLPWSAHRFSTRAGKGGRAEARSEGKVEELEVLVATGLEPALARGATDRGTALGRANNRVRTLADLPANILNPRDYRSIAEQMARTCGLKTEFIDTRTLAKLGAGAFLAVARADLDRGAGILKVKYAPARAKGHVVLVGKGICFDTGGYNIKTGAFMHGMHSDMTGSALALALACSFAELKLPIMVTAYLALAENLISPNAYKPNEVVTACDGTTIEVVDTDAEGRMLLSDTLALARREKSDLCLDFATLTGAAIRALDRRIGAVFSNDAEGVLLEEALAAGRASGERVWAFPCGGDYRKGLKSEIADLLQCSASNNADHIYAATFLSHFIGTETPWVHLDLTPATCKGGLGLIESDTTGFGVRWATELVSRRLLATPEKRQKGRRSRN